MRFYFLLTLLPFVLGQATEVECPDENLTTYLLALIDTLYDNGLTYFESLLVASSESDEGYALLESWFTDDRITLFVPTDSAFQKAGLSPPFDTHTPKMIADTVAYHTTNGQWTYDQLPPAPAKGFADTQLVAKEWLNSTVNTDAKVPLVLQQGQNGTMTIRMATGNATTWGWVINGKDAIWNVDIIPIDSVLDFPPKLSTALTLPTTSRSKDGLLEFNKALDGAGGPEQLETLTEGGFTIFVPVDDAFTPDVKSLLATDAGVSTLGNHYATNYSLFSRIWVDNGPHELPIISGGSVTVQQSGDGATVTLHDQTVRILRSDVVLENGVMHIIDNVLIDPRFAAAASGASESSSASSSPAGNAAQDGSKAVVPSNGGGRNVACLLGAVLPILVSLIV